MSTLIGEALDVLDKVNDLTNKYDSALELTKQIIGEGGEE